MGELKADEALLLTKGLQKTDAFREVTLVSVSIAFLLKTGNIKREVANEAI